MSWTDSKNCRGCDSCGMDMDMTPYCVNEAVLTVARERDDRHYDYGLNINYALKICKLEQWEERKPLMCECGKRRFDQCNKNITGGKMCLK